MKEMTKIDKIIANKSERRPTSKEYLIFLIPIEEKYSPII